MDQFSSTKSTFSVGQDDMSEQFMIIWGQIREPLIVPLLKTAVFLCLAMSVMLFVERVYMAVVITLVKFFGRKPEKRYKWEPLKDDLELGNSAYPMVLVQIPMYNEKEVCFSCFHICMVFKNPRFLIVFNSLCWFLVWGCISNRFISSQLELHVGYLGRPIES